MTMQRARANEQVLPVTSWENEEMKGLALCGQSLYEENIRKVEALRARQSNYRESLPAEPAQAIKEVLRLLHPDSSAYVEGFDDALHVAFFLRGMVREMTEGQPGPERDAAIHIADMMWSRLQTASERLNRIADILGKANEVQRNPQREGAA